MRTLNDLEISAVGGAAVSDDAAYGAAVGVGIALLGAALTVTAPVWGTGLLLGCSIGASFVAMKYVLTY